MSECDEMMRVGDAAAVSVVLSARLRVSMMVEEVVRRVEKSASIDSWPRIMLAGVMLRQVAELWKLPLVASMT